MPDNLTVDQRRRAMSRVRRRDTLPELRLRRYLWEAGMRGYRIDVKGLPGRPDIAWAGRKVAVFVDGAFWHGHPSAFTPGKHGGYWDAKIRRNMERDRQVDRGLRDMGWVVVRLWDFEVRKVPERCLQRIKSGLRKREEYAVNVNPNDAPNAV